MSLSAAFQYWCKHHEYKSLPATYIAHGMLALEESEARIVRGVSPADRATKHRNPQTYTIELRLNDEFTYPLGNTWLSKQQLLAAMVEDTMERKAQ